MGENESISWQAARTAVDNQKDHLGKPAQRQLIEKLCQLC